ncbi:MAG: hypothetical protein ACOH2M_33050 [Cypionkella sp.]
MGDRLSHSESLRERFKVIIKRQQEGVLIGWNWVISAKQRTSLKAKDGYPIAPQARKRSSIQQFPCSHEQVAVNLELNMKTPAHDNHEAQHQHRLPGKLGLLTLPRRREVGTNKSSARSPLAQLIGRQPGQFQDIPRSDQTHRAPPIGYSTQTRNGYHAHSTG